LERTPEYEVKRTVTPISALRHSGVDRRKEEERQTTFMKKTGKVESKKKLEKTVLLARRSKTSDTLHVKWNRGRRKDLNLDSSQKERRGCNANCKTNAQLSKM